VSAPQDKKTAETATEPIIQNATYTLTNFQRITGFGRHALRTAKKQGLVVKYAGGRAFVSGNDFIEYLNSLDSHK